MAWNLGALLEELDHKLQDHPRYTDSLKVESINRAIVWLILFISENFEVSEAPSVVDPDDSSKYLTEVPLPDDCLFLQSLSWEGNEMRRLSQTEYVRTKGEFNSDRTGPPFLGYYIRSNRFINFFPRPGQAGTFQIYYLQRPPDLVVDADVPGIEEPYSEAITSRAAWWLKDGIPGEEQQARIHLSNAYRERAEARYNIQQNSVHKIHRKG